MSQLKIRMVMQRTAAKLRFFFDSKRENKTDTQRNIKKLIFQKIFTENETFFSFGAYYMMTTIQKTRNKSKI